MIHKYSSLFTTFLLSVVGLSTAGAKAIFDGAVSAISSDPGILSVTPNADGTFVAQRNGLGSVTVTFSADADLGDSVRTISKVIEFEFYDSSEEADHIDVSIQIEQPAAPTVTEAAAPTVTEAAAAPTVTS